VIGFFQGELIFLFIISINLHNLRTVSGFFLLNNDDSFNVFGLLKSILELDFFYQLQNLDTVIHNEIRHQSREIDIADTVYCVFLHLSSALLQSVIYD
jgi:hypothetical protein